MELVIIRTFDNYIKANMTLGKLQDNGIECFLEDEFSSTIMTNAVVDIKLLVKDDNADKAIKILKEMDAEYLKAVICPNCEEVGLVYNEKIVSKSIVTILLTKFFSNFSAAPQYVYHCTNCGWESKTLPDINSDFISDDTVITG